MITLDVTRYGKKLTLSRCSDLWDEVEQMMSPIPIKWGVKERLRVTPDELLISQWQAENIFNGGGDSKTWETWRGIPIRVE